MRGGGVHRPFHSVRGRRRERERQGSGAQGCLGPDVAQKRESWSRPLQAIHSLTASASASAGRASPAVCAVLIISTPTPPSPSASHRTSTSALSTARWCSGSPAPAHTPHSPSPRRCPSWPTWRSLPPSRTMHGTRIAHSSPSHPTPTRVSARARPLPAPSHSTPPPRILLPSSFHLLLSPPVFRVLVWIYSTPGEDASKWTRKHVLAEVCAAPLRPQLCTVVPSIAPSSPSHLPLPSPRALPRLCSTAVR